MQNTNTGVAISYLLVDTQEEVLQEHYYHVNDINAGELTAKLLDKGCRGSWGWLVLASGSKRAVK